jgi:hypothetical protein
MGGKKLAAVLIISLCAAVFGQSVSIEVIGGDTPVGDFGGLPSFEPGDWIIIGLSHEGFGSSLPDGIFGMEIDYITGQGTAANLQFNPDFDVPDYTLRNFGGILFEDINVGSSTGVTSSEPLCWFDFYVPDVAYSTILMIDAQQLRLHNAFDMDLSFEYTHPLELHVTPEPAAMILFGLGGLWLRKRRK